MLAISNAEAKYMAKEQTPRDIKVTAFDKMIRLMKPFSKARDIKWSLV